MTGFKEVMLPLTSKVLFQVQQPQLTSNRSLGFSSWWSGAGAGDAGLYGGSWRREGRGGGVEGASRALASLGSRSGGAEHCDAARPTSSSVSVRSLSVPTGKTRFLD